MTLRDEKLQELLRRSHELAMKLADVQRQIEDHLGGVPGECVAPQQLQQEQQISQHQRRERGEGG